MKRARFWVFIVLGALSSGRLSPLSAANWSAMGPSFKVIKAVASSPQDTAIIFAGAFGWGMFKSTDAGATWTSQRSGLTNAYVRSVLVISNSVVFCGTNDGVFKSSDGGATWVHAVVTPFSVRGLAFDGFTGALYAATFGAGLYKSTNMGSSWTPIIVNDPGQGLTLSHLWTVAVYGHDSLYVGGSIGDVATGGALFKSQNGGASWTQVQQGIGIRSSVHAIAISPTNPDISLIIGTAAKGVYKSTNGGANWTEINGATTAHPIPDEKINAVAFSTLNRYAGTDSLGGLYLRALGDTAFGWSAGSGLPGSGAVVSAIHVNPSQASSMLLATEGGGVFRSTSAGASWSTRSNGMMGTAARVLRRNGDGRLFAGMDFGDGLWVSSDQGASWNAIALGTADAITAIATTNTPSTLYAGAYGAGVFKSTNAGATWAITDSTILNHFVRAVSVHPANGAIVYAGTGNGVYGTTDGGASWSARNGGIPASTSIRSMAIDPVTPSTLYAGTDSLYLYKSTDGGTNWTHVTSANGFLPQDVFIRTLTIDYANHAVVYAGSDSGRIYKSTNSGATWALHADLGVVHSVRAILIHPSDHRIFFCATFGDGVFVSADSGAHWAAMNGGFADTEFYSLESDAASPLTLYAGSGMHGVYRTTYSFVNHPPVLAPIGNQNVIAGDPLAFVVSASDSDGTLPALSVTGLPAGAAMVDSGNGRGRFAWTPGPGQVGTYLVHVIASDGTAADTEAVAITVLPPGSSTIVHLTTEAGWNILSVPVVATDPRKSVLFSTAASSAFAYTGSYAVRETLMNGSGYWLKYASDQSITLGGGSLLRDTVAVRAGWNLLGSLSTAIPAVAVSAVPPEVITSSMYGFSAATGYATADSLRPGYGYWVKVTQDGQLVLAPAPAALPAVAPAPHVPDDQDMVAFTDRFGQVRTIFLRGSITDELPPPPPSGVFDARVEASGSSSFRLFLANGGPAVTVSWDIHASGRSYELRYGGAPVILAGRGSAGLTLPRAAESGTILLRSDDGGTSFAGPTSPTLRQNYPNPFNPSTSVRIDLPSAAFVDLRVYDVLGREVAVLEHGELPAGSHTRQWDAATFGSGVYFCRFAATETGNPAATTHRTVTMNLVK